MEILPTLDLYNFTEPIATESQYILTSPRSLEACARFGIKPVELLPKSPDEIASEYGPLTESTAVLCKKFEKERLRKLRLCRQERERIIDESARDDFDESDPEEIHLTTEFDDGYVVQAPDHDTEFRENGEVPPPSKPTVLHYMEVNNQQDLSAIDHQNREDFICSEEATPACADVQRVFSDPPTMSVEPNPCRNDSQGIKQNKLCRSKSLRVKKEKRFDDGRPLTPEESYGQSRSLCPSPALISSTPIHSSSAKKPNKVKRTQSFRVKKGCSQENIVDVNVDLHKEFKESLSLASEKDRKVLNSYFTRTRSGHSLNEPRYWNGDAKSVSKQGRRMSCPVPKTENEVSRNRPQSRNENYEGSKWKTKYDKHSQKKMNKMDRDGKYSNTVVHSERPKPRKPSKTSSPTPLGLFGTPIYCDDPQTEHQIRHERMVQMKEITEKHKRAGETFQERMKQKIQQREYNKLRQQERKGYQERQLQMMEKDLKLWQEELKAYQEICLNRASKLVEKRNAITSAKTHEKRHQKEVEHAMLKSKVDEEEKRRQDELKQLVNIKETRSKMIISAKEEFANAGRESATLSRNYKNSFKNTQSSFDKMASTGARMARLEQMNGVKRSVPNTPTSSARQNNNNNLNRKNQSKLTLG